MENTAKNIINLVNDRTCSNCAETKSITEFYIRKKPRHKGEKSNQCKKCVCAFNKANKVRHLAENSEYWKAKWKISKDKSIAKKVGHYQHANKDYQYRKKYGITLVEANRLLEFQMGLCANRGCGNPLIMNCSTSKRDNLGLVDHNHETGMVRGILCNRCNVALGHLENKNLVLGLTEYLHKYEGELA